MARLVDSEIELNRIAHRCPEYGIGGHKHAPVVKQLIDAFQTGDVLDYGCGKQTLSDALGIAIRGYDPAIPGLDVEPDPADIVVCTDVLEHIKEENIGDVMDHINTLTKKIAFFIVSTRTAIKHFHDGSNFHRTVKPATWWIEKMMQHMDIHQVAMSPDGTEFLATFKPLGTEEKEFEEREQAYHDAVDRGDKEIVFIKEDGKTEKVRYGVNT
jgi:hypothetical protein